MVKSQAPGYHRNMLGDFEVTAISDGTVSLPMIKLLTNTEPELEGYMVGVTHVALPGLGHLRAAPSGKSYTWGPLNYSSLK